MSCNFVETLAGVRIPDPDDLVIPCASNETRILGELRASKTLSVTKELAYILAGINVPQLDAEITTAGYDGVTSHLDRVDGSCVPAQLLDQFTRLPVPDTNGDIFGAGDYVPVIEGQVQNGSRVTSKPSDWLVTVPNIMDDTGAIRRTRDQDFRVILKTKNGGIVMDWERDC